MKKLLSTTALVLTLALSGMAYAHDDGHKKDGHKHHHFMEAALAKLPKEDAEQFRETMKEAHEKNKQLFGQMKQLHEELHGIMTAEEFDKSAFLSKHEEMDKLRHDIHKEMRANMHEAFATALSQLPQNDRKILADAMKHEHEMHHWHHGEQHNDDKPA